MRSTSKALVIVIVLQGIILAGQWLGSPSIIAPVNAQITDPGKDRMQMIDEMKSVNAKLDKLIDILESGDLQVRTVSPDETKAKAPAR
jgi:hypothetical protein